MPEEPNPAVRSGNGGVYIALHVQPGAKREGIVGLFGSSLKVALNAPPVEGKANAALLRFLSAKLGVARNAIELCAGTASREKRVFVAGLTVEKTKELLEK